MYIETVMHSQEDNVIVTELSREQIRENRSQDNVIVTDLSREQIRENRRNKRIQKREALKTEKQAQREQKKYEELMNKSKSDKLKVISEEEMMKYRRNQHGENPCEKTSPAESCKNCILLQNVDEFFPSLSKASTTRDRGADIKSKELAAPVQNVKPHNASRTFAKSISKKNDVVVLDQKSFPELKQAGTRVFQSGIGDVGDIDGDQTGQVENIGSNEIRIEEIEFRNTIDAAIPIQFNDTADTETNKAVDAQVNIDIEGHGCCLKNARISRQVNPTEEKMSRSNRNAIRPYYCINLLQSAKIKQKIKKTKSIAKRKTATASQNEGNPLDSTKPIKMNRGKHYERNQVIRKNKKRMTKVKKIISNYRKAKKEDSFIKDLNFNIFLTREFLDTLSEQMERDSKFNNVHEKQILLFNEFTNKRNKNKLWKTMREYIRNEIKVNEVERKTENSKGIIETKDMKQNILVKEEVNRNDNIFKESGKCKYIESIETASNIVKAKENPHKLIEDRTDDNDEKVNCTDSKKETKEEMDPFTNEINDVILLQPKPSTDIDTINSNIKTERVLSETIIKVNEQTDTNNIHSRKLKRIEKKQRKNHVINLDETIVAAKTKQEELEERKLDLNRIVDRVVKTEDIEHVCSVKEKMHSRRFRPYCNQMPLATLRKASTDLIKQIVQYQERLYKTDPVKGGIKRRYIVGMKEVMKSLPIRNKVKILFIAPDLECVPVSGGIEDEIQSLLTMATIQGVPYLFSLPRRVLGSLTYKRPCSCLAVLDYSGCEDTVDQILSLIAEARRMYDENFSRLQTGDIAETSSSTNSKSKR